MAVLVPAIKTLPVSVPVPSGGGAGFAAKQVAEDANRQVMKKIPANLDTFI
jgi:hypothetical protein